MKKYRITEHQRFGSGCYYQIDTCKSGNNSWETVTTYSRDGDIAMSFDTLEKAKEYIAREKRMESKPKVVWEE